MKSGISGVGLFACAISCDLEYFFFVGGGIVLGNVWTGSYKTLRGIEGIQK